MRRNTPCCSSSSASRTCNSAGTTSTWSWTGRRSALSSTAAQAFEVSLSKGQHELVFREAGESEPVGKVDFVVEGEGDSFSYEIHCTRNRIKVDSIGE